LNIETPLSRRAAEQPLRDFVDPTPSIADQWRAPVTTAPQYFAMRLP
jgi:hypothetical protein